VPMAVARRRTWHNKRAGGQVIALLCMQVQAVSPDFYGRYGTSNSPESFRGTTHTGRPAKHWPSIPMQLLGVKRIVQPHRNAPSSPKASQCRMKNHQGLAPPGIDTRKRSSHLPWDKHYFVLEPKDSPVADRNTRALSLSQNFQTL